MNADQPVTHFAPTEQRKQQQNVMCSYVSPGDAVTTDPAAVTCQDCRDWIGPTEPPPAFKLEDPYAPKRPEHERAMVGPEDILGSSFSVPVELAAQYKYRPYSPPEDILGSSQFDEDLRRMLVGDVSLQNAIDPSLPPPHSATLEEIAELTKHVPRRPRAMLDVGFPLRGYQVSTIAASLVAEFPRMFDGDVLRPLPPPLEGVLIHTSDSAYSTRMREHLESLSRPQPPVIDVIREPALPPLEKRTGHRKGYRVGLTTKGGGKPPGSKLARKAARGKL